MILVVADTGPLCYHFRSGDSCWHPWPGPPSRRRIHQVVISLLPIMAHGGCLQPIDQIAQHRDRSVQMVPFEGFEESRT
jgi:hypothetical protein